MMEYEEAKMYLEKVQGLGMVPGLTAIRQLLEELQNPQNDVKIVHIAGTNGKGSVGAYLGYMLASAGYRVGRYVSPAVFDACEIIQILEMCSDNITVSCIEESAVAKHIFKIKAAVERIQMRKGVQPTRFEIETAMAFLEFKEKACDIVLLEAGMGGRLDATNIAEKVECAVFTSISMDHMAFLGNTLEDIAREKAGIIKKHISVVSAPQKEEVCAVLQQAAGEQESELFFVNEQRANEIRYSRTGIDFIYCVSVQQIPLACEDSIPIHLPLFGVYQIENALTALLAAEVLNQKGYVVTRQAMQTGCMRVVWHGRFEVLHTCPTVIADGAHNADAAEKMVESIHQYLQIRDVPMVDYEGEIVDNFADIHQYGGKLIYVFGMLRDKEVKKVIEKTAGLADVIYTVTPDSPRAMPSGELFGYIEEFWHTIGKTSMVKDSKTVKQGVWEAFSAAEEKDCIVVFGSLSLMREVKQWFDRGKYKTLYPVIA